MAIRGTRSSIVWAGIFGWTSALLMFFPIFWMMLAAFKTEIAAIATPPLLFFSPTLENFSQVNSRADYVHYALNSVFESLGAAAENPRCCE